MAAEKQPSAKTEEVADEVTVKSLAQGIHRIAEHLDNGRVQQTPISKAHIPTPWNPEGKFDRDRPKLSRRTYQNGGVVNQRLLTEDEIRAWNAITPGRFGPDRKWVVIKRSDGGIELRYPNKSIEERMEFQRQTPNGILSVLQRVKQEAVDRKARRKAGLDDEDEEAA